MGVVTLKVVPEQPRAGTVCEVCAAWIALADATDEAGATRRTWWEVSYFDAVPRPEHTATRCRALRTEHGQ